MQRHNGWNDERQQSQPTTKHNTAAAQLWNRLPDNVTSANSLSAFQQQLKRTLFQQSFPDIIM